MPAYTAINHEIQYAYKNDDPAKSAQLCAIRKTTLTLERCREVPGAQDVRARLVQPEFNKDGTEVWVSAWTDRLTPGFAVIYDATTREEKPASPESGSSPRSASSTPTTPRTTSTNAQPLRTPRHGPRPVACMPHPRFFTSKAKDAVKRRSPQSPAATPPPGYRQRAPEDGRTPPPRPRTRAPTVTFVPHPSRLN